jgi:NAD dependent epimerase/dehydratase family enzyme
VEAINSIPNQLRPSILVSATAVGYYGMEVNTVAELENEYSVSSSFVFQEQAKNKHLMNRVLPEMIILLR